MTNQSQNTCPRCEYASMCKAYTTRDTVCNSNSPYGKCSEYRNYKEQEKREAIIKERGLVKKLVSA